VEDAAHAFGSVYKGKKVGTFGDITCFSFDPIKIITCGEGGALAINNKRIAQTAIKKRILGISKDTWSRYKHKRSWFYNVETLGFRYHMSNINAAIGLVQIKKIKLFLKRRQEIVRKYDDLLKDIKEVELLKHDYKYTAPFNYIVKVKRKREKLMKCLKDNGIGSGIHYIPNHIQPFFALYRTRLPVTEKIWKQILTLPLYYGLKDKEIEKIAKIIKFFFKMRQSKRHNLKV
ncbi:MAG: DegT/DnrJ/EryC1/StrS family aminotransferase, partial [Candidatus Omnitrophica bacterium]|nr:DegT/DnrJ/EryC1/StrS family aminotransferase [Candidatus Omnitrophota bacterium]